MTDCTVPAHVVVYAIRYGLNRATGAHDEALALIREHWPALRPHRDSLLADLRAAASQPHPMLTTAEIQAVTETADWIKEQP